MSSIGKRLVAMEAKVAELDRRLRNAQQSGVVTAVNTSAGLARVKLADGDSGDFLTPWIPWKEISAGNISTHIPPSVGQQVDVLSRNGDLTDAVIDFSCHSDANPRPASGSDAVILIGRTMITIGADKTTFSSDVEIDGSLIVNGKSLMHGGKDVGNTHKHTDSKGGTTSPPL